MACGHVCERWLIDVGGPGPLWEAPFPRQAVLGCRGKLPKREPVSEPASSVLQGSCLGLLLKFLL